MVCSRRDQKWLFECRGNHRINIPLVVMQKYVVDEGRCQSELRAAGPTLASSQAHYTNEERTRVKIGPDRDLIQATFSPR